MKEELQRHEQEALARVARATAVEELRGVEREYLDKGGVVAELLAGVPKLAPEQRPIVGKGANLLKRTIQEALDAARTRIEAAEIEAQRSGAGFDGTLPGTREPRGSLHPLTQVRREVEDLFSSMGYTILDGPEVELDYYNFQALNIPPDHPSREMQDTFYCDTDGTLVMRTQTSPIQIRAMERMTPPFRVIAPGRVFRCEEQDATHEHTFHQVEGLVVDEGIHVGHLSGTLKGFLRELFQKEEVDVRLRPGFFPFVEPGFEFDVRCPFCPLRTGSESPCRVCKGTTWIEFCGCGLVHPNVLRNGGIDPERYSGFAFGFGLDRLVMMRNQIDDIRHFMAGDLRFLEQF